MEKGQLLFLGRMSRMKNNMHPRTLLSATTSGKRSRGRQHRSVRDSMVENINLMTPNVVKDDRINNWLKCSKDITNWEHVVKIIVFRDRPNNSSGDEEEDDDEGCDDSSNEPLTQVPPQTPHNDRSRNMGSDKCNVTLGIMVNGNPNMTKDEAIKS